MSKIPKGFEVAHKCGKSLCCNPAHLKLSTPKENAADKKRHGTQPLGESMPLSKLTEAQVRLIRSNPEKLSTTKLAKMFGVCFQTVSKVLNGETWKHVL